MVCWRADPHDRSTGKAVQESLERRGIRDERPKTSESQLGEASALRKAMKTQSEAAVNYQLVEGILMEVCSISLASLI